MDYDKEFKRLKIETEPLPSWYTPERYARQLMKKAYHADNVSYSNHTTSKKVYYRRSAVYSKRNVSNARFIVKNKSTKIAN